MLQDVLVRLVRVLSDLDRRGSMLYSGWVILSAEDSSVCSWCQLNKQKNLQLTWSFSCCIPYYHVCAEQHNNMLKSDLQLLLRAGMKPLRWYTVAYNSCWVCSTPLAEQSSEIWMVFLVCSWKLPKRQPLALWILQGCSDETAKLAPAHTWLIISRKA